MIIQKQIVKKVFTQKEELINLFNGNLNKIVKNTAFIDCKFIGMDLAELIWLDCEFENTNFENCKLIGTHFNHCKFTFTNFIKCYFEKSHPSIEYHSNSLVKLCASSFKNCKMNFIKFFECNNNNMTLKHCESIDMEFKQCDLTSSEIILNDFNSLKMFNCNLYYLNFSKNTSKNTEFVDCSLNIHSKFDFIYNKYNLENNKRVLQQLYRLFKIQGYDQIAVNYYLNYKKLERQSAKGINKIGLYLLHIMFGDGEEITKIFLAITFTILTFATIYSFTGINLNVANPCVNSIPRYLNCLYFSIVTFSTLGFGDISPASTLSMIFVIIEVILGLIYTAVMAAVFYKKISS